MLLRDGELFVHLPGAAGLRIVDGELYGVLGKASRTINTVLGAGTDSAAKLVELFFDITWPPSMIGFCEVS